MWATSPWLDLPRRAEFAHRSSRPPTSRPDRAVPEISTRASRLALVARRSRRSTRTRREAWEAAARGEHLILATSTASGKSLAFNLPVLDTIAREPKSRALYLYPTKALAQDQARALGRVARHRNHARRSTTATRRAERRWQIRKWANVILTNPDMLHVGVLPHHDRWADVLANLRYVVVDEAHVYRGVFGSHVGNVLRRLRRLARVYGRGAAVPAGVGDDRQPRPACRVAARRAGDRRSTATRPRGPNGRSRSGTRS